MTRDLDALSARTFDLAVVGGGITGVCIAHDAVLRGLSVALVEKGDFGAATSSASSKVLHGGIRYLQQARPDKVRESARERMAFLQIAPHLVRWIPFLVPTLPSWSQGRLLLGAGIGAFRLLCAGTSSGLENPALRPPRDYFLTRDELTAAHPVLESLGAITGAWVIHEAHMHDSERMTLAFAKSAASRGATLANYAEVVQFLRDGPRVTGVAVRDGMGGRRIGVAARVVVNASGPWMAQLNGLLGGTSLERDIRAFSKGVHLVTRPLMEGAAVALPTPHQSQAFIQRGGRHFFIIPWRGQSLVGTTNVPFGPTPGDVLASREDVETFVAEVAGLLPGAALTMADVQYAYAGLYPLTEAVIRPDLFQGTGNYQLVDHGQTHGVHGLVSALGAKYTTARRLAARTVDVVCRSLNQKAPSSVTWRTPLTGGDIRETSVFLRELHGRHGGLLPPDAIEHLGTHYGSEADAVVRLGSVTAGGLDRLTRDRPTIEAQVRYAVQQEMALRLDDVVFRRTGLGTIGHPGKTCLDRCAAIMAESLGWDAERRATEVAAVERRLESWRR